ncbi:lysozyme inhibitor LprI family protein [Colwellia sp. E2M01]|uniref:lysozyme inhibitor LprI family protein n=1 Tax=Colwellia sp. E2M01 TaxID=2841561 RepID=UPI001C07F3EA|nr:lysozyme inhibitor LprI family protein [Colwellia sp. E2M01]MBU2870402.1 hypothetical protein [Colwellia sp. E2M01]
MKRILWGLSIAICMLYLNSVNAASFDCKKAGNYAERVICTSEKLSSLDDELSVLYKKLNNSEGDWRESQLTWLKDRNSCKTQECLLTTYQTRVLFFESLLAKKTIKITRGAPYQLCKDYAALMSRVTVNPESSCKIRYSFDTEAYDAGFADIRWKEVEKSKVKSILSDFWVARYETSIDDIHADISQKNKFTKFISTHKTIWITNMDINFDGAKEKVYRVSIEEQCSGNRFSYFILPMFDKRRSTIFGDIFMYQGRPYLDRSRSLRELSGSENVIHQRYVCEFK